MAAFSRVVSNAIEKLLFHPMAVTGAERVGECFRLLHLQGRGLLGVNWVPGQATQVFLGNLTKRAYTPMELDPATGSASFLIYLHGEGPGSAWATRVKAADICQVMRPKDSLNFTNLSGPALFFGDETSLAAAQALHGCARDAAHNRYVLEENSPAQVKAVLDRLGVGTASLVQKTANGSHLIEIASMLAHHASAMGTPQWIFTGQALSIQSIRKRLKTADVPMPNSRVRAYWSPGKKGMD